MSEPDVVAIIDALLVRHTHTVDVFGQESMDILVRDAKRARDEIVTLRAERERYDTPAWEANDWLNERVAELSDEVVELRQALHEALWLIRAEALNEAAAEAGKWATGKAARSAIRALKDHHE